MKKEKFYLPLVEVIILTDEIITTSQAPYDPFDPNPGQYDPDDDFDL